MALSKHYRILKKNISMLRRHLLPKSFTSTGEYPARVSSRVAAYRILAHSEFEYYLENIAREITLSALKNWTEKKSISVVLLALMAFSGIQMELPPESLKPLKEANQDLWKKKIDLEKKVRLAVSNFINSLRSNHGIKEKNLLRILLPLGFPIDSLDTLWLSSMNSFGEKRGEAAHISVVQQTFDPKTEHENILLLLDGLETVDGIMNSL